MELLQLGARLLLHTHCANPLPPFLQMPRINQENINVAAQKRCIPEVLPSIDDLRLSMQPSMQNPPRLSSVSPPWLQQQQQQPSSCKVPEAQTSNRNAMKQQQPEVPRLLHSGNNNNSGSLLQVLTPLPPSLRISHLGACAEREESRAAAAAAVVVSRDNNTGMSPHIITRPAADEGSQTGLKGSSLLAGLINNNNSTPAVPAAGSSGPPPLPRRPVKPAPSGGSADSILPSTTLVLNPVFTICSSLQLVELLLLLSVSNLTNFNDDSCSCVSGFFDFSDPVSSFNPFRMKCVFGVLHPLALWVPIACKSWHIVPSS